MNKLGKIGIGFFILIVVFSFFKGLPFFILSIVCTLGISLVVWVPLAFFIGTLACKLFGIEKKGPVSKEQQALRDYVSRAKNSGLSSEEIKKALKDKGWSEDEIAAAGDI
jgi:hypothetical protein